MKKRILSILLVCVMLIGLLPTVALAEGETPTGVANASEFSSAINAGGAIKLTGSFTLTAGVTIEKNTEIDFNGNTITFSNAVNNNSAGFTVDSGVTFKVYDTSAKPGGVNMLWSGPNWATTFIKNNGTVEFDDITVSGGLMKGVSQEGGTKFTMNSGTINATHFVIFASTGSIVITDGILHTDGKSDEAIYLRDTATATIDGGEITAEKCHAITCAHKDTSVSISGGKIVASGDGHYTVFVYDNGGTASISGGKFTRTPGRAPGNTPGTITVTGGTFDSDPTAFVPAAGFKITQNEQAGTWTVEEIFEAQITKTDGTVTKYKSFNNAIEDADEGGDFEDCTVELLEDIGPILYTGESNKAAYCIDGGIFTVDGNGHTITLTATDASNAGGYVFNVRGDVTFEDLKLRNGGSYDKTKCVKGGINVAQAATVIINNCDIDTIDSSGYWGAAAVVVNNEYADVTINGGSYKGGTSTDVFAIDASKGKLTFVDGVTTGIKITNNAALFDVQGGKHSGVFPESGTISNTCKGISGGLFTTAPDAKYLADGYEVVDNDDDETKGAYPHKVVGKQVAKIGEKIYNSLAAAIAAAVDDDTVTLLANTELKTNVEIDKKITLDLAGKTVECGTNFLNIAGDVTITGNGTINKEETKNSNPVTYSGITGKPDVPFKGAVYVAPSGKLTIKNGTYTTKSSSLFVCNNGILTMEDGLFKCTSTNPYDTKGLIDVRGESGVLNVLGGSVECYENWADYEGMYGVSAWDGGTMNLGSKNTNGPTVHSYYAAIATNGSTAPVTINVYSGTYISDCDVTNDPDAESDMNVIQIAANTKDGTELNIYGGTFTQTAKNATTSHVIEVRWVAEKSINIYGGNFNSAGSVILKDTECDEANTTIFITGGYYSDNVSASVASGYACVANTDSATVADYPWKVVKSVDVSGVSMSYPEGQTSYIYGDTVKYSGTPAATADETVTVSNWTYTYYKNAGTAQEPAKGDKLDAAPANVGSYVLVVAANDAKYTGEQVIPFTIGKKTLTVTADNKNVIVGGVMPTLTYTVSGLVGNDKLTGKPTLSCTPTMNAAGSYEITVSGGTASDNYKLEYVNGKLTVLKQSQSAPAKGEGYTIRGTTLKAKDGYQLLISDSKNPTSVQQPTTELTISEGNSYFVRFTETDAKFASPYTAIDTTVSVAAIASPASMGTVSISGVINGKCQIGASVTATATAKDGYEFVEWRNAAGTKIEGAEASYPFTANISTTLTAVFKVKDKQVATLPTVQNFVYDGGFHMGVVAGTGCVLDGGTYGNTEVGTYTATAKLAEGYDVWPDGTTADKTIVWSITPKTQEAPQNLTVEGLIISPVTNAMEYKLSTDNAYTPVPTNTTSVTVDKPGTYYVRMKATDNALASKITVVVVKEPTISAVTIQPADLETTSALFTGTAEPYSESRVTGVGFEYKTKDGSWTQAETTKGASFSYSVAGLTQDTDYIVRAFVTYTTEGEAQPTTAYGKEIAFHTRKVVEPTVTLGEITAGATVEGTVAKKVIISVEEGNDVIASAISAEAISAGSTFKTTFENLPDGNYNVVVRTENGEFTETRMVTIEDGATVDTMFTIPVGKLATVVDVKTAETPKVAVEGLAEMLTDTDKNAAAVGTQNVEIKLEAQKENVEHPVIETTQTAVEKIQAIIPPATSTVEEKIETVLDLSLIKTTTELENDEVKSVEVKDIGSKNNTVIEVAVPYATEGKTLKVYRYHDGVAEELTLLSSRPSANFIDGTYFIGDGYVFIYASGFSTYAISYEETKTVTGGGGGGVTTYAITGADTVNGKLTVDKKNASSGSTVTITVKPDKGYTLETLTVLDKNGKEVEVKNLGENKYSFKMPSSKVTISATFVKLGVCPQDATCVYAKFTDADTKEWYHDGVHYCVENGMMNGVSDTQFAPSGTLTRGMVVTVLARLSGATVNATGEEWYADGQKWAVENGISDGTNMTANITREQLATMLYRYAQLKKVDVDAFTKDTNTLSHNDVFTISDWATSGMHFCIAAGIVGGDDHGNLNPLNNATRAEAAAMFQRFCEKVLAK